MKTLFEIVLFEDCGNQWSLSRPMLSMILISEEVTLIFVAFRFRLLIISKTARCKCDYDTHIHMSVPVFSHKAQYWVLFAVKSPVPQF